MQGFRFRFGIRIRFRLGHFEACSWRIINNAFRQFGEGIRKFEKNRTNSIHEQNREMSGGRERKETYSLYFCMIGLDLIVPPRMMLTILVFLGFKTLLIGESRVKTKKVKSLWFQCFFLILSNGRFLVSNFLEVKKYY